MPYDLGDDVTHWQMQLPNLKSKLFNKSYFMYHINRPSASLYSLPKLTLDWLIFAKIFVIFVRFRGVLRPWSRFYREYEDNVNLLMQMVW